MKNIKIEHVYIVYFGCIQIYIFSEDFGRFFNLATASRLKMRSNVDLPANCFGGTVAVGILIHWCFESFKSGHTIIMTIMIIIILSAENQ